MGRLRTLNLCVREAERRKERLDLRFETRPRYFIFDQSS
jgi:hypothetical protein